MRTSERLLLYYNVLQKLSRKGLHEPRSGFGLHFEQSVWLLLEYGLRLCDAQSVCFACSSRDYYVPRRPGEVKSMSHNGTGVVDVDMFVLSADYNCQLVCFRLCMVLMVVDTCLC